MRTLGDGRLHSGLGLSKNLVASCKLARHYTQLLPIINSTRTSNRPSAFKANGRESELKIVLHCCYYSNLSQRLANSLTHSHSGIEGH